ncbi:MAG: helix-turn-helix transcriptional regulator [Roseobacter sp.]|jgi:transcriptional regulator with XRE-family HTH domain|nr:helix-turn-helix transcriptional regulator [Roseobacter sp.]
MFDLDMQRTRVEIGKRIRRLRLEMGLTQGDLAAALGHSSPTRVNQIELGRLRLYAEELPRLCDRLDCSLSDIVGE